MAEQPNSMADNTPALMSALMDNFPDMIHSVDDGGNIVFFNNKALELLGYAPEELDGPALGDREPHVLEHLPGRELDDEHLLRLVGGGAHRGVREREERHRPDERRLDALFAQDLDRLDDAVVRAGNADHGVVELCRAVE